MLFQPTTSQLQSSRKMALGADDFNRKFNRIVTHHGIHQHRIIDKSSGAMPINCSKLIHLIVLQLEFPFKGTFPLPFSLPRTLIFGTEQNVFLLCVLFISTKDILSLKEDATPWISYSNTFKVQLYPHLHYIKGCCICIKPFTSQEQK